MAAMTRALAVVALAVTACAPPDQLAFVSPYGQRVFQDPDGFSPDAHEFAVLEARSVAYGLVDGAYLSRWTLEVHHADSFWCQSCLPPGDVYGITQCFKKEGGSLAVAFPNAHTFGTALAHELAHVEECYRGVDGNLSHAGWGEAGTWALIDRVNEYAGKDVVGP